jgi:hypothetical protein
MREADYVVNNLASLKKDIGDRAEYSKILPYLILKRKQWYLKNYLMLCVSMNSLEMTLVYLLINH